MPGQKGISANLIALYTTNQRQNHSLMSHFLRYPRPLLHSPLYHSLHCHVIYLSPPPFIVFPCLTSPAPPPPLLSEWRICWLILIPHTKGGWIISFLSLIRPELVLSRIPTRCHALRMRTVTHYPSSTQPLIPNLWLSYPHFSWFCASTFPIQQSQGWPVFSVRECGGCELARTTKSNVERKRAVYQAYEIMMYCEVAGYKYM